MFLLARSAFSEITSLVKQKAATDQETFAAVMVVMVVTVVVLAIGGVVVTCNLLFLVDFFWLCLIGFIVQIYVFNRFYLDFMFLALDMNLISSSFQEPCESNVYGYCMCVYMYIQYTYFIYAHMCVSMYLPLSHYLFL